MTIMPSGAAVLYLLAAVGSWQMLLRAQEFVASGMMSTPILVLTAVIQLVLTHPKLAGGTALVVVLGRARRAQTCYNRIRSYMRGELEEDPEWSRSDWAEQPVAAQALQALTQSEQHCSLDCGYYSPRGFLKRDTERRVSSIGFFHTSSQTAVALVRFGADTEGPEQGFVSGGCTAAVAEELSVRCMRSASDVTAQLSPTRLTVQYRQALPLGTTVRFRATIAADEQARHGQYTIIRFFLRSLTEVAEDGEPQIFLEGEAMFAMDAARATRSRPHSD